ncbi:MAG: phosphate-starvation-inducible E [Thioploca sp.]|nr:phosphate-starvation-inducible E [Thioploca sp.]
MTTKHRIPPLQLTQWVITILEYLEWLGLLIITLATVVAVGQEVYTMLMRLEVRLEDILLLFIFLEILTMVGLYFASGKLPIRYPLYIAIVAIARYITIGMKQMPGITIITLSSAILILVIAVFIIRYSPQDHLDE